METKKVIRKEIFRRRKEADPIAVHKNSEQIWQKLFSLPAFQESGKQKADMDHHPGYRGGHVFTRS